MFTSNLEVPLFDFPVNSGKGGHCVQKKLVRNCAVKNGEFVEEKNGHVSYKISRFYWPILYPKGQ